MPLTALIRKHVYSYISENNFVPSNQIIVPTGYKMFLTFQDNVTIHTAYTQHTHSIHTAYTQHTHSIHTAYTQHTHSIQTHNSTQIIFSVFYILTYFKPKT